MIGVTICDRGGPCGEMKSSIALGTVLLYGGYATWNNGMRLTDCPNCGGSLAPAVIADWPWAALRAAGMP